MRRKNVRRARGKGKKAVKLFFKAAGVTGIGIGLFLLALIAPLINNSPATFDMQALFMKYGLLLMLYTGAVVFTFIAMRKMMVPMHLFMQWVYLPTLAIMFGLEAYEILTK